jgi:hypothetical protein
MGVRDKRRQEGIEIGPVERAERRGRAGVGPSARPRLAQSSWTPGRKKDDSFGGRLKRHPLFTMIFVLVMAGVALLSFFGPVFILSAIVFYIYALISFPFILMDLDDEN